jgi:hypothetical protein
MPSCIMLFLDRQNELARLRRVAVPPTGDSAAGS